MDKNLDKLLFALDEEIERKCFEIKKEKSEQILTKVFIIACSLFLTIPIILGFAGVNLLSACVPIVLFLSFSIVILFPLISNNNLGGISR